MDGETARVARGAALTRGVMGFLAILTLGMPLVVVAAYYAVGWKAAVLAFPLLLMGLGRLTPSKNQDEDANRRRIRKRFVTLTILYAVPVAAVWWDNPEIMRVWAYATVLPFSLFLASDGKGNISRTATILAGVIFVALSDLIWLFGSIGPWIWFHAFAVPIFFIAFSFLTVAFAPRERGEGRKSRIEKMPPPPEEDDQSSLALRCVINRGNGETWEFKAVSRSQVQAIYAAAEWRQDHDDRPQSGAAPEDTEKPSFMVAFNGNGVLKFEADGPSTVTVQWIYMEARQRGRLFGSPGLIGETKVPATLGRAIIADVWNDDVASLKARLQQRALPVMGEN